VAGVGDEDVRVQVGVAGPAAAVLVGGGDEPVGLDDGSTAVPAAHAARDRLVRSERGVDGGVVSRAHFGRYLR